MKFTANSLLLIFLLSSCGNFKNFNKNGIQDNFYEVHAKIQTTSVDSGDDAADDPAFWYNADLPSDSRIIGTDKQKGIGIYKLSGELDNFALVGKTNNCDVQYNFFTGSDTFDIIGASNRSNNTISVYSFNRSTKSLEIKPLVSIPVITQEVYGFCFYKPVSSGLLYAISVGKDGLIEKYLVRINEDSVGYDLVWKYKLETQCEGLVADNEQEILYVGEENAGIWKFFMNPAEDYRVQKIADLNTNQSLRADIEGLTLYYTANNGGYLIASSQGNNSYAVFERNENNKYLGSFRIVDSDEIDGTSETDGIDVINLDLGDLFPMGVFIAQDGNNRENGKKANQNFKLVPWDSISKVFDQPLIIDKSYTLK